MTDNLKKYGKIAAIVLSLAGAATAALWQVNIKDVVCGSAPAAQSAE